VRPLVLAAPYSAVLFMAAREAREQAPAVVALVPVVTAGTHLVYGLGTLWGLVRGGLARIERRPSVGSSRDHDRAPVGRGHGTADPRASAAGQ
jgi:hypothetical protein